MEIYSRSYYEVVFERDFLKKTGTTFQDFFSEIMEKRYPGDFQRVRPWGKLGDRKNDGYLRSKRMLFQVYAPNKMKLADTLDKINEDFSGALPYWEGHFDYWVFTHNSRQGLSGDVLKRLLELEKEYPHLKFPNWGYEELKNELFSLADIDIAAILGPAPSMRDVHNMGYAELKIVLKHISNKEPLLNQDISPTPNKKISSNGFSPHVETLIRDSHIKAVLVEKFFTEYYDPEYGDKIAKAFNDKYLELKSQNTLPDNIFMKLQEFAGGAMRGSPKHEAAVLAVLAYLFERCDIFEKPRSGEES